MKPDYTQIVEGCRRGDRRSQRALYDAMTPMALGICLRYSKSRTVAQDLMQDGFVSVFENIKRLKEPESLGPWVYRLMVNRCINYCRREAQPLLLDVADQQLVSLPLDPFSTQEVIAALQRIGPQQRLVFNMIEVEGYSREEVAAHLGCTEEAVRSNLSRAKDALRKILTHSKP